MPIGGCLAWREDPDERVPLFPAGPCPCGLDLAEAADLGVTASLQVIGVPLAAARVIRYNSHAVECACGRVREALPRVDGGEPGTVTWALWWCS